MNSTKQLKPTATSRKDEHNRQCKLPRIFCLLLLGIFFNANAANSDQRSGWIEGTTPARSNHPEKQRLKGGVEHSAHLNPVDLQLRAGLRFNEQFLPQVQKRNVWYMIPDWFAGKWHRKYMTTLSKRNLRTNRVLNLQVKEKAEGTTFRGFQTDSLGRIWQYDRAPYRETITGDKSTTYIFVKSLTPVEINSEQVVLKGYDYSIDVINATGRIIRVSQTESIITYAPSKPARITQNASTQTYSENGRPYLLSAMTGRQKRIKPYKPVDYYEGKDMRLLFKQYLHYTGKPELIPDHLKNQFETKDR